MRIRYSSLRFTNLLRRYIVKLFVLRSTTTLLNMFLFKDIVVRMRSRCSTLRLTIC
jgi:hypothetical protein